MSRGNDGDSGTSNPLVFKTELRKYLPDNIIDRYMVRSLCSLSSSQGVPPEAEEACASSSRRDERRSKQCRYLSLKTATKRDHCNI